MQKKIAVSLLSTLLFIGTLSVGLNVFHVFAAPVVDGVINPGEYDGGMAVQLTGQWDINWTVDAFIWSDTQYLYVAVDEPVSATTGKVSWIEFCIDAGPSRPNLDAFVLFDDGTLQYVTYPKPSGGWSWASSPFPWSAVTNTATEFQIKYTDYGIAFNNTIKLVIDRNLGPPPPSPLGKSAYWPGHEEIVYPTPDVSKWGNVTLGYGLEHVVDGVIGSGEYDGGMGVVLVGRTDTNWTVDGYIDWDNEYLYVAVNETVPSGTGTQSWIEFCFDAGPSRPYLDAFALFCSGLKQYVRCPKPPGSWGWLPYAFLAATDTATEFKVKYTDFGIALGDTIKLAIDRNQGPAPPPPYGFAAFWPQNATVYFVPPVPATWGDVHLSPQAPTLYELTVNSTPISGIAYVVDSQAAVTGTPITLDGGSHTITMPSPITVGVDVYNFAYWEDNSTNPVRIINLHSNTVLTATYMKAGHVVDGVIGSGEYDGGMGVVLVGRTDTNWTVDGYIDWDDEYLYVAVNESVPATTGHKSWIEFAFDAGPARPYLDAFILFDDGQKWVDRYLKPSGPWTQVGLGNFSAVSGVATEFKVKYADFGIALGDTIKLAIDRNQGPSPPPPYGFAAFWPQNATVYYGTPQAQPATWGDVTLAPPVTAELFVDPPVVTKGPAEVGGTFNVSVKIQDVADLFAFDINITWDATLITFAGLDRAALDVMWPQGYFEPLTPSPQTAPGYVRFAAVATGGTGFTGSGALFDVTFNILAAGPVPRSTPIHFDNVVLSDSGAGPIDAVFSDGQYNMGAGAIDVAVTSVTTSKDGCMPKPTVPDDMFVKINVTVFNKGTLPVTFTVTLYANLTAVDTQPVTALAPSVQATLNFRWNTTGWAHGNYTVSATATVAGDANLNDNTFTNGIIRVVIPGDISGDGIVDIYDAILMANSYNATPESPNWSPNSDLKTDSVIDIYDAIVLANHYNQAE